MKVVFVDFFLGHSWGRWQESPILQALRKEARKAQALQESLYSPQNRSLKDPSFRKWFLSLQAKQMNTSLYMAQVFIKLAPGIHHVMHPPWQEAPLLDGQIG